MENVQTSISPRIAFRISQSIIKTVLCCLIFSKFVLANYDTSKLGNNHRPMRPVPRRIRIDFFIYSAYSTSHHDVTHNTNHRTQRLRMKRLYIVRFVKLPPVRDRATKNKHDSIIYVGPIEPSAAITEKVAAKIQTKVVASV